MQYTSKLQLPKDPFERSVVLVVLAMVALVVGLVAVSSSTGLHVRKVEINGSGSAAELQDQRLIVHFNRPLLKESINTQVGVSPAVNYNISWQGNDMVVNFNDNLRADTDYMLIVGADAQDVYHNSLGKQFQYRFHTKPLRLVYLQPGNEADQIISVAPDLTDSQELYSAPHIFKFAVSKQYLAVTTAEPGQAQGKITIVNLKDKSTRDLVLPKQRVIKVLFSAGSHPELAVIVQNLLEVQGTLIPDAGSRIRIYDLANLTYREVNPQGIADEVIDMFYSADGSSMLFKVSDSNFYIADLRSRNDYIVLNKHLAAGGFNRKSDKVLFVDFDPLQTYTNTPYLSVVNSDKSSVKVDKVEFGVDPQFMNNQERIVLAEQYKELEGTKGIFRIVLVGGGKKLILHSDPNRSVELPKPSADDHYIVAERYEVKDMQTYNNQRDFQFQTKPAIATLLMIDMDTGKVTDKGVRGIDAQWQP